MENSDHNAWSGTHIFAHLNDFEASVAENILEINQSQTVVATDSNASNDDRDKIANDAVNVAAGNTKIGIKIPKFEVTNKSYVLQCQEDMTQDFIDYLKEMSTSYVAASETGKIECHDWQKKVSSACNSVTSTVKICFYRKIYSRKTFRLLSNQMRMLQRIVLHRRFRIPSVRIVRKQSIRRSQRFETNQRK